MPISLPVDWPAAADEAEAMQEALRPQLVLDAPGPAEICTAAGLDVAYADNSDLLTAAVTVLDVGTLAVVESAAVVGRATFPYLPGLLAFRELPPLIAALQRLRIVPDLLVCDGYGIAHPRRFGLACHVGVLTGLPTIGVAKTPFIGSWEAPASQRGAWSPLMDAGEVIGRVVRTCDNVRPVFVSVGSGVDLETATRHVLTLTRGYRLPETTRTADRLSRITLAGAPR